MRCHSCEGKGWVDSRYRGAMVCPVCGGSGNLNENRVVTLATTVQTETNKNSLLLQVEQWLVQQPNVKFHHVNKSMNTYNFLSNIKGRMKGLAWVSTNGASRIHLCKGDYNSSDPDSKVKYENVWGDYPQFEIKSLKDFDYFKNLISYAIKFF